MRKFLFSLIALSTLLFFTNCNNPENNTITLVLDYTPNTNHTGFYVAQEKGFYKDLGIQLEIVQPPESGAPILVASGQGDFGISYQDDLAAAYGLDEPLGITTIASLVNHNTSGFIYNSNADIKTPKDFEGEKVVVWDTPIITEIVNTIVEEAGGDPEKVELVYDNVTNTHQLMQEQGVIVWGFTGWDFTKLKLAGLDVEFMDIAKINPVFDYYTPVIIANYNTLSNETLTRKFLQATEEGYRYAIDNPQEAVGILCKANPELDKELVTESQLYLNSQYLSDSGRWGEIDEKRWETFYDWVYDNELVENSIDLETFTNDYLG